MDTFGVRATEHSTVQIILRIVDAPRLRKEAARELPVPLRIRDGSGLETNKVSMVFVVRVHGNDGDQVEERLP